MDSHCQASGFYKTCNDAAGLYSLLDRRSGAFQLVSAACSCPSIPVPKLNKPSQSKPSSGCTGVHLVLLDPDLRGPDRNPASQQPPEPRDKSPQNPTHD